MDYPSKAAMSNGIDNQLDQCPIDEFSSQLFELYDSEMFSEVNSNSNCCNDTNFSSFIQNTLENNGKTNTATTTSTANSSVTTPQNTAVNNNQLPVILDSPDEVENNVNIDPIDLSTFPQLYNTTSNNDIQQNQVDYSSFPSQNHLQYSQNLPLVGPPLPSVFGDECLSFMPANMRSNLNPSGPNNAFLESAMGSYFPGNLTSVENSAILNSGLFLNSNNEIQLKDLDFQGDNGGIFCADGLPRINFNPNDLQALNNESQHVANGGGSSNPLASDLSSLEDSTFKIRKLSPEERREKIHRYMKKRNERNFSKKIKYACRKTLADSRPRVRGRFAKNDELESLRAACINHEEDMDDDSMRMVKEEELFDSSEILGHISAINAFNYSTSIQPWRLAH